MIYESDFSLEKVRSGSGEAYNIGLFDVFLNELPKLGRSFISDSISDYCLSMLDTRKDLLKFEFILRQTLSINFLKNGKSVIFFEFESTINEGLLIEFCN